MVIDTSALMAILQVEHEALAFVRLLDEADRCLMSAANLLEAGIVMFSRRGMSGLHEMDLFVVSAGIEIAPFDRDQAVLARQAAMRYGRGRHPAGLNFGDCMAYALAKSEGLPLLFKGGDFARTDVTPAALSSS
jgi:ribonuclease VapC